MLLIIKDNRSKNTPSRQMAGGFCKTVMKSVRNARLGWVMGREILASKSPK
jgi:hypothetical protein